MIVTIPIHILGTGAFLPGQPLAPDQVDEVLGPLDGLPDALQSRVERFRDRMLQRSGVHARHFAIDPKDRRQTESCASMAEKAIRAAAEAAGTEVGAIDLLLCSSPASDCQTPPTSVLLQERLGLDGCTEIEIHSNCSGVAKALQIAIDMLRQGRYRMAAVVYSQVSSVFLRREYLNPRRLTLENLILRWLLSDGAGAMILAPRRPDRPEILDAYVESVGVGSRPGMTAGVGVADGLAVYPGSGSFLHDVFDGGHHHLWQDVSAVTRRGVECAVGGLRRMLDGMGIRPEDVRYFAMPLPSRHFFSDGHRELFRRIVGVESDGRLPFLVDRFGYCGGAASLVQFDYMVRGGFFQAGDLAAVYAEESSKWMSGGFVCRFPRSDDVARGEGRCVREPPP
jgi:3-oxoacyl-[acyl-carrier-protein] synthase-3